MTNRLLTVLLVLALIAAGYWYITTPKANGGDIAMRTLQAAGYENIQLSPAYVLSGCNEGDTPIANFTATQNGATVSGLVCKTQGFINVSAYVRIR